MACLKFIVLWIIDVDNDVLLADQHEALKHLLVVILSQNSLELRVLLHVTLRLLEGLLASENHDILRRTAYACAHND